MCTRRLQQPRDDCAVQVQWFSSVYILKDDTYIIQISKLFSIRDFRIEHVHEKKHSQKTIHPTKKHVPPPPTKKMC